MKTTELKPCPNCGGQPKIHKTHKKFYVECDGDCWTQTEKHSRQEDAVKEWNTQIAVANEGRQMTDHKFTDDVTKTLKNAKYKVDGVVTRGYYLSPETFNAVVDLINRQKAEIEKLKGSRDRWKQIATDFDKASRETEKEIERLTTLAELGNMRANDYRAMRDKAKTARAEAIKEFAWRLKSRLTPYPEVPFCEMVGSLDIDALVEEMTEDLK